MQKNLGLSWNSRSLPGTEAGGTREGALQAGRGGAGSVPSPQPRPFAGAAGCLARAPLVLLLTALGFFLLLVTTLVQGESGAGGLETGHFAFCLWNGLCPFLQSRNPLGLGLLGSMSAPV